MAERKILLIEDCADLAHFLPLHLRDLNCAVEIARSGTAGKQRALAGGHNPIVLDLILPELFSLDGLVQDVCHKLGPAAASAGVALAAEVEAPGRFVEADIGLIERAITNLVEKTVEFTQRGGRVAARVAAADGQVIATVEDTGVGLPEADLPHVFDSFYRIDATPAAAGRTGLGLAVVMRVAELHGGAVDVASTPGAGTVVRLRLPTGRAGQGGRARSIPQAGCRNAA
jgi:signal transduction histidine kinase